MTSHSYAITAFPRHFGSVDAVTDIDLLMSRIDDAACAAAAAEIADGYRQVFPPQMGYDVFDDMNYVADAPTDPNLLQNIENWDEDGDIVLPSPIILNTVVMRALLRKMLLGLFTAYHTVIDEPYPTYDETQPIWPNDRPFIVAGGPEVDGGPPNTAYDAIMVIDELGLFDKSFTDDEIQKIQTH